MYQQTSRCTGHCCRNFTLPFSPMEMNFWHKVALKTKQKRWGEDTLKVPPMLIYLYSDNKHVNASRDQKLNTSKITKYHYTCKNYDNDTGNCKIYDDRPNMCKSFNDRGQNCTYRDCTCKFEWVEDEGLEKALKKVELGQSPFPLCENKCGECKSECRTTSRESS